jgi:hypothetical protein
MLIPNSKGIFTCETKDCTFTTPDLFDLLDHVGVEFTWDVKVTPKHSFDLFAFLCAMSDVINEGSLDEAYDMLQSAACLFVNVSSDELEGYIEESIVAEEAHEGIKNIERMLRENGQD